MKKSNKNTKKTDLNYRADCETCIYIRGIEDVAVCSFMAKDKSFKTINNSQLITEDKRKWCEWHTIKGNC